MAFILFATQRDASYTHLEMTGTYTVQGRNPWIFRFESWVLQMSSDFGKYIQLLTPHSLIVIWQQLNSVYGVVEFIEV